MKPLSAILAVFLLAASPAVAVEPELYDGERLVNLKLPDDGKLTQSGWTRSGRAVAYRMTLPAGAELTINMTASAPRFTYLVIFDLNDPYPEEAVYSSDTRRLPAHLFADAERDMDLLIRPFFAKQAPRRGLGSRFVLEFKRTK